MTSSGCSMPRKNPSRRQRPGASLMHQNRVTLVPKYRSRPLAVCPNFKVLEGRASNSTEGGSGCVPRSRYYQNQYLRSRVRLRRVCVCGRKPSMKPTFGPVGCDTGAGGGTGRRAGFRCRCLRTCGFESHPAHHSPSTSYPLSHSIPRQTNRSPMWRVTETRHLQQLRR